MYSTLTSLLFLRLRPALGYHGAAWAAFATSLPALVLLAWALTLLVDDPTVRCTRALYGLLFGKYDESRAAHRWVRRRWEGAVKRWEAFKGRGPVEGGWVWWLLCVDDDEGKGTGVAADDGAGSAKGGMVELPRVAA